VDNLAARPRIPESFLEYRQVFADPWVDRWITPNPFVVALISLLRPIGVGLSDFSFNKDGANVGETYLNISIANLNAAIRIGLDTVTFTVVNPYWEIAPKLVPVFDQVSESIRAIVGSPATSQQATLAFHVTPGMLDFAKVTTSFLNTAVMGESQFCGISLYRRDEELIIDKSRRHEGAAFVRLQRRFGGDVPFADVASQLYQDEVSALLLLGISEVPS
jgi:hypothetical protein